MEAIINVVDWPHVTLIFAVVFILVFRRAITGLISRTKSINRIGLDTVDNPKVQDDDSRKKSVQELLDRAGTSNALQETEKKIKRDLLQRGLESDGDTVNVLVKYLATFQVILEFEQINNPGFPI